MPCAIGNSNPNPRITNYFWENESNYLAGIFASLQEANTDHVTGDLSRIGGLTVSLRQHRGIQTLEQVWVVHFEEGIRKKCDSDQDRYQYLS